MAVSSPEVLLFFVFHIHPDWQPNKQMDSSRKDAPRKVCSLQSKDQERDRLGRQKTVRNNHSSPAKLQEKNCGPQPHSPDPHFPFITNAHRVSFPLPAQVPKGIRFSTCDKMHFYTLALPSMVRVAYLATLSHYDDFFLGGFFFWQY